MMPCRLSGSSTARVICATVLLKRQVQVIEQDYTRSFASRSLLSTLSPTCTLISLTTPSAAA